jgi:hypothetical protein
MKIAVMTIILTAHFMIPTSSVIVMFLIANPAYIADIATSPLLTVV